MSDDGAARPYNRPRRYPVPPPAAAAQHGPDASGEVTRQNPSLAEAAQEYARREGAGATDPLQPFAHPTPPPIAPPATAPRPQPPPTAAPGPSRTVPTRVLVLGIAVLVVVAVIGLVVGLSRGDDPTPGAHHAAGGTSVDRSADPSSGAAAVPATPSAPSSVPAAVSASPREVCDRLGATAPFASYVAAPRPTGAPPPGYLEPQGGTRVGLCVGTFRPGAGAGRGRLAYLAEYARLPATRYAAALKTEGWAVAPTLPQVTFRRLGVTVTLVPQGTTLVTVVGTGG